RADERLRSEQRRVDAGRVLARAAWCAIEERRERIEGRAEHPRRCALLLGVATAPGRDVVLDCIGQAAQRVESTPQVMPPAGAAEPLDGPGREAEARPIEEAGRDDVEHVQQP